MYVQGIKGKLFFKVMLMHVSMIRSIHILGM